jgi:hypothetical protein
MLTATASGLLEVPMMMSGFVGKGFQLRAADCLGGHHVAFIDLDGGTKDWRKVGDAPALGPLRGLRLGRSALRDDGA